MFFGGPDHIAVRGGRLKVFSGTGDLAGILEIGVCRTGRVGPTEMEPGFILIADWSGRSGNYFGEKPRRHER